MESVTQLYDRSGRRKYLTEAEAGRLLEAVRGLEDRVRTFCLVLYWTGCRISEALELTPERIDREASRLVLRTLKRHCGRQSDAPRREQFRAVPVPREVIAALDGLEGRPGDRFWPWGRQAGWRRVKQAMRVADVEGGAACPKGLRHHFGLMAAAAHVPPSLIQRWMGHAKIETTMIYLDAVGGEERRFAEKMWQGRCGGI